MERLNIKTTTWLSQNLSWAEVIYNLINAFDDLGHNSYVQSTNGLTESAFKRKNKMIDSILGLQRFGPGKQAIDLDLTYTCPQNYPSRFLSNSKHKAAIYTYEYQYWRKDWHQFYHLVDHYFPPSLFAAEVFCVNGIAPEKVFVIPHGVDSQVFNSNVKPVQLKTQKKFKFISVCAPHYRKKIDRLLKAYCQAFDNTSDVCLVLKTKLYNKNDKKQAYETCVSDYLAEMKLRYGDRMPEIEILDRRIDSVASLLNSAQVNVTTTGAEGFYLPGLESMASGLINIAPRYSGQLDFLNDQNSLLIKGKMVKAKSEEQYWGFDQRNLSYEVDINHTSELMLKAYHEYDTLLERFEPAMKQTVEQYSWKNAAQKMIDVCEGKIAHYKPGTIRIPR